MNFVEPIRDRKKIAQIKKLLRGQGRLRDLLLFTVGINSLCAFPICYNFKSAISSMKAADQSDGIGSRSRRGENDIPDAHGDRGRAVVAKTYLEAV